MNEASLKWAYPATFIAAILAANYATTQWGFVPVGFGLTATAGTYFAGICFVARDLTQDTLGKLAVLAVIATGAALSYVVASHAIATASAVAFAVSELIDLAIYTPLRTRGMIRAATASNIAGAFADTIVFLTIAGFPVWSAVGGQMVGKLWITLAFILTWAALRALPRHLHPRTP